MSREAMEAVQDHSTVTDPFGISVFIGIARFVAADTKMGWVSDRTVAAKAHCDKDSVKPWRDKLVEAGEIETWTTGSGRGTRRWYKLLLPFDQPTSDSVVRDNIGETSRPGGDNTNGTIIEGLSQQIDLLSRQIEVMSQRMELMSPGNVPNVPPRGGQEHHNTKEEHHKHQGGAPSDPFPFKPNPVTTANVTEAEQRAMIIAQVCNLDLKIPKHRKMVDFAASQVSEYSPGYIAIRYLPAERGNEPDTWYWWRDYWLGAEKNKPPDTDKLVETIALQRHSAGMKNGQHPAGKQETTAERVERIKKMAGVE